MEDYQIALHLQVGDTRLGEKVTSNKGLLSEEPWVTIQLTLPLSWSESETANSDCPAGT